MKKLVVVFVLLLAANAVLADALSPNSKSIKHQIQIDNLSTYPEFVFFVYPFSKAAEARKSAEVKPGATVTLAAPGKGTKLHIYAVPKTVYDAAKGQASDDWFDPKQTPAVLESVQQITRKITAKKTDPTARIVTHYDVAIKDGKLTLPKATEKRYDANDQEVKSDGKQELSLEEGGWYYVGVPSLACVLIGVALVARRKKVG